jgi:hypothetical protein
MSKVVATYLCELIWILPKGVKLQKNIAYPNPGSYTIDDNKLHYVNKKGVKHTITTDSDCNLIRNEVTNSGRGYRINRLDIVEEETDEEEIKKTYLCELTWILPKGVELDKYIEYPNPGSYTIDNNNLHYIDTNGAEHTITTDSNYSLIKEEVTKSRKGYRIKRIELEEEETDEEETKN